MPVPSGTWVQIEQTILKAGERAPQLPTDTQQVPLMLWAKGKLLAPAEMGEQVTIATAIGRQLHGKLVAVNPGYEHTFGAPLAALQQAGERAKKLLAEGVKPC